MSLPPTPEERTDLRRGEQQLAQALEELRARVAEHREAFFRGVEDAVTSRIAAVFSEASQAHSGLLEELGVSGGFGPALSVPLSEGSNRGHGSSGDRRSPPTGGALRGGRLRRYRQGLREQVMDPLRSALGGLEIGKEVGERWMGYLNGMASLVQGLPESIQRPEPADLYAPDAAEGRATAFRKLLVRRRRAMGYLLSRPLGFFRRLQAGELPRAQLVPLRRMAHDCLLGSCPLSAEPFAEVFQQHHARPIAALEAAIAAWTEDWFGAEEAVLEVEGVLGVRFMDELSLRIAPESQEASARDMMPEPVSGEADEVRDAGSKAAGLGEICEALSDALMSGASLTLPDSIQDAVRDAMEKEWARLLREIEVSGSFQETSWGKKGRSRAARALERQGAKGKTWQLWHANALGRLHLCVLLLRLREDFDDGESRLMGTVADEALRPIGDALKEAWGGLRALVTAAQPELSRATESRNAVELLGAIEELLNQAESLLSGSLPSLLETGDPFGAIQAVADSAAAKLSESLRFLPETISFSPLQSGDATVAPTTSVRTVPLRESAHRSVDVLRLEAIRNSVSPLLDYLETAAHELAEIPTIVSYNLTAAREELESPSESSLETSLEGARSLTLDGLTRTARSLRMVLEGLGVAWMEFTRDAHELFQKSFREIHSRAVAEGAVQEQMLGLQALARAWVRSGAGRSRIWLGEGERRLAGLFRKAWIRGIRLVRLGRSAVGEGGDQVEAADQAVETLRGLPALLNSLPLVYRRLYSFQPISDPNLMVGRDDELKWVERKLEGWRSGNPTPCIFTGPLGVGHTSFMNLLASTRLKEWSTHRLVLDRRIRTEEELTSLLAGVLGCGEEGHNTLHTLAGHVLRGGPEVPRMVILVEHLEHLILRAPGGTDLLEKFLTFQAQTGKRILWLSNTSGATWKIMEKSEPTAVAMVAQYAVSTPTREETEELIMARHRRSGLPVEFLPPSDLNPLIRRRLRLARGEKAKQQILRAEFFDRIHRMSEGSIPMTILLWLRSTDFKSKEGWLRIHAPQHVPSAFLDGLDLESSFALKAFMEHGSLTLEEYGEIFGNSPAEAYQIFEALRARMILEPFGSKGVPVPVLEGIAEGQRYRVPRLLSQVVANRLKNKNILH